MKITDNLKVAFGALRSNPMRSFLTALGVVIGVTAVIMMVSIGEGARALITNQIRGLGSNLLMITSGRMQQGRDENRRGTAGAFGSGISLDNDVVPIIAACPSIQNVAPEAGGNQTVSTGTSSVQTSVIGTTPAYPVIRNLTMAGGSFFTDLEEQAARKVAVLGNDVVTQLFPDQDPIGQSIKIGHVKFTVIGTLATKGQSGFMSNDDVVYIPLLTAQRRLQGNRRLRMIYAQARSEDVMDQAAAEVDAALLAYLEDENAYMVSNQADTLSTAQQMTTTLTLLLAGIAGISLLVGGIGIMNIMLVSVTERIREIGIRKAIGAREEEILGQFLLEAATLSLLGGVIGIILGFVGAAVLAKVLSFPTSISTTATVLAFCISLAIGLFFGVYPARKASQLDPIVALRHE